MLKKMLTLLFFNFLIFSCGNENKLVVGVTPIPHKELVELVKEDLEKEGIELEIVEFTDYVQPNKLLATKELDANFFQHIPYMEEFGRENNIDMVSVGAIHIEPIKAYSDNIKNIYELKDGDEILIPNDPTNRGRALLLLDNFGIIKLKDNSKLDSNVEDIVLNNKNLNIVSLNSEQIAPRLSEVSLAIINTNNALAGGITKYKAILVEGKDSPYVNVVTVLRENKDNEKVKKLVKALQTEKVKKFIEEKYNGEVEAAF